MYVTIVTFEVYFRFVYHVVVIIYPALVNILKFFVASEEHLLPKHNIFIVANEVSQLLLHWISDVFISLSPCSR